MINVSTEYINKKDKKKMQWQNLFGQGSFIEYLGD